MCESNDNNVDIAKILGIDEARVDEILQACYKRMKKKQGNTSQPDEIIHFMVGIGQNEHEKFLTGFLLARIYMQNMDDHAKAKMVQGNPTLQDTMSSMFG